MKSLTILLTAILLTPFIMRGQQVQDPTRTRVAQISLIYPIGSAGTNSMEYANYFSVNLTYGLNGGVKGIEIGGVGNFNKGKVEGIQIGGITNINTRASKGVFLAGVTNMNSEGVAGVQAAGIFNLNAGEAKGMMVAGLLNSSEEIQGVQVAGLANVVQADIKGFQLSGLYNSAKDVGGIQVAGLINIARTVKGVQLASLINIADTSDYSIGLINLVKSGEKSMSVTLDETGTMLASFRSGGRVLYSILGVGGRFRDNEAQYAAEGGFGAFLIGRSTSAGKTRLVSLRAEALAMNITDFKDEDDLYFRASMKLLPGIRKGKFELFAGPTFNYVNTNQDQTKELVDNYLWEDANGDTLNGLYLGFTGGLNYIF